MSDHVTGIGGFFFRAKDPAGLADWYETRHLGISEGAHIRRWDARGCSQAGPTVFAPFAVPTPSISAMTGSAMLNLRVTRP